jgi:caffeoyl-CoA O-methyltransferase
MTSILDPAITSYLESLHLREDNDVVLEMEALARERSFPIVGRLCGVFLEVMAGAVGARRVFEFGSGFGYSAYWFSRAVGPEGSVICTEAEEENVARAESFLRRAGRWDRVDYHCDWAQDVFARVEGDFDVIYNDANKEGYPEIWEMARERIRPGGLYIVDNTLWKGAVADAKADDDSTVAIRRHNLAVAEDPRFEFFLHPVRDGLITARRKEV